MVAAMLISGTIGWFVLVSGQAVVDVVFWRCLIGGGMLLLVCAVLGLLRAELLGRRVLLLAVLSGVAIVGNWLLLFASYAQASIAVSTVVYNVQPFMLVGLAALFLGERITKLSSASLPNRPMMYAISSTFCPQTFVISSTNLCTIDLPATGINGLGVVKVCGRILLPMPAIGTIILISSRFVMFFCKYINI